MSAPGCSLARSLRNAKPNPALAAADICVAATPQDEEESLYNLASEGIEGRQVVYDAAAIGGGGGGTDELPYLLLDMRDQDAFEAFHIKCALRPRHCLGAPQRWRGAGLVYA